MLRASTRVHACGEGGAGGRVPSREGRGGSGMLGIVEWIVRVWGSKTRSYISLFVGDLVGPAPRLGFSGR